MVIKTKGSKFYTFRQNNSGGYFDINQLVSVFVIIEAFSADEANEIAETKGIYFNGVDQNIDCACCGDRWRAQNSYNGNKYPTIYGNLVGFRYSDEIDTDNKYTGDMPLTHGYPKIKQQGRYPEYYIYYLDGSRESGNT